MNPLTYIDTPINFLYERRREGRVTRKRLQVSTSQVDWGFACLLWFNIVFLCPSLFYLQVTTNIAFIPVWFRVCYGLCQFLTPPTGHICYHSSLTLLLQSRSSCLWTSFSCFSWTFITVHFSIITKEPEITFLRQILFSCATWDRWHPVKQTKEETDTPEWMALVHRSPVLLKPHNKNKLPTLSLLCH